MNALRDLVGVNVVSELVANRGFSIRISLGVGLKGCLCVVILNMGWGSRQMLREMGGRLDLTFR